MNATESIKSACHDNLKDICVTSCKRVMDFERF